MFAFAGLCLFLSLCVVCVCVCVCEREFIAICFKILCCPGRWQRENTLGRCGDSSAGLCWATAALLATVDTKKPLHVLVAVWMTVFRLRMLLLKKVFPLFSPSFSPFFFYLISLANGNFLGSIVVEWIVVVTKRNGGKPCVRMSVFSLFYCLPVLVGKEKRRWREKEGEECRPASRLVFRVSSEARQDLPVWSFALCERCEKCLTLQEVKWQRQTHVVNAALLMVWHYWTFLLW